MLWCSVGSRFAGSRQRMACGSTPPHRSGRLRAAAARFHEDAHEAAGSAQEEQGLERHARGQHAEGDEALRRVAARIIQAEDGVRQGVLTVDRDGVRDAAAEVHEDA